MKYTRKYRTSSASLAKRFAIIKVKKMEKAIISFLKIIF